MPPDLNQWIHTSQTIPLVIPGQASRQHTTVFFLLQGAFFHHNVKSSLQATVARTGGTSACRYQDWQVLAKTGVCDLIVQGIPQIGRNLYTGCKKLEDCLFSRPGSSQVKTWSGLSRTDSQGSCVLLFSSRSHKPGKIHGHAGKNKLFPDTLEDLEVCDHGFSGFTGAALLRISILSLQHFVCPNTGRCSTTEISLVREGWSKSMKRNDTRMCLLPSHECLSRRRLILSLVYIDADSGEHSYYQTDSVSVSEWWTNGSRASGCSVFHCENRLLMQVIPVSVLQREYCHGEHQAEFPNPVLWSRAASLCSNLTCIFSHVELIGPPTSRNLFVIDSTLVKKMLLGFRVGLFSFGIAQVSGQ